jgi:NADH-quinone oxidoreductase subunit L
MHETVHGAAELVTGIGPTHPSAWLFLIPLLPFIGAAINGILGYFLQKRFGKRAISVVAVGVMVAAAAIAVVAFCQLLALPAGERTLVNKVLPMINLGSLQLDLTFMMDELSGTMALIVTVIGMLIHVYSTGYMADEPSFWRYFSYLNLFVFSMMMLVLGDSFLLMFFGWEGVGLCSYLLIGFWYQDQAKATAGMKAFIVNRIGDFGFIVGLFLLFWGLGGGWSSQPGRFVRELPRRVEVYRAFLQQRGADNDLLGSGAEHAVDGLHRADSATHLARQALADLLRQSGVGTLAHGGVEIDQLHHRVRRKAIDPVIEVLKFERLARALH